MDSGDISVPTSGAISADVGEVADFLSAVESHIRDLQIEDEDDVNTAALSDILALRMDTVDAIVAATLLDLENRSVTPTRNDLLGREQVTDFLHFSTHFLRILRSLWVAIEKPMLSTTPYETILNLHLKTAIENDFCFNPEEQTFMPVPLMAFLDTPAGIAMRNQAEEVFKRRKSGKDTGGNIGINFEDSKCQDEDDAEDRKLSKKRCLKDEVKPRKSWTRDLMAMMKMPPDFSRPGRNPSEGQLMRLLQRSYLPLDSFADCSGEDVAALMAERRRRKLQLLDDIIAEKNRLLVKSWNYEISEAEYESENMTGHLVAVQKLKIPEYIPD